MPKLLAKHDVLKKNMKHVMELIKVNLTPSLASRGLAAFSVKKSIDEKKVLITHANIVCELLGLSSITVFNVTDKDVLDPKNKAVVAKPGYPSSHIFNAAYSKSDSQKSVEIIHKFESTFIMIKPDGVQRNLVGEIIKRFENRGLTMLGMKMVKPSLKIARKHYADLSSKGFYNDLVKYLASGPVIAMIWQGPKGTIALARKMIGETNPLDSNCGTIRGDYSIDIGRNIIHGSDCGKSAMREIALWFKKNEKTSWTLATHSWIYEK